MSEVTVRELAEVVGIPVDRLLVQLGKSGLPHTDADQRLNEQDKAQLLGHLRQLHGGGETDASAPRKFTLKRKSVNELKISTQGRKKTITVEVRKRRTYIRNSEKQAAESVLVGNGDEAQRMEAAKQALHDEAKRRHQEIDERLRSEEENREKEETARQIEELERRKVEAQERASEQEKDTERKKEEEQQASASEEAEAARAKAEATLAAEQAA
ncbi:MAG: translation initiation factor IF-2 associated domain-containing protein, partial [Gammaproteobacteria bacterium]|nr:translation initiation factor IF-2 associated domain-containing protein [Gammaproteobacteria bacterium]